MNVWDDGAIKLIACRVKVDGEILEGSPIELFVCRFFLRIFAADHGNTQTAQDSKMVIWSAVSLACSLAVVV